MVKHCTFKAPMAVYEWGEKLDNLQWETSDSLARSLAYLCTYCGLIYAKLTVRNGEQIEPFSAVHGCCSTCQGNQYYIPGSLEALSLAGWRHVPQEIIAYQLNLELNFAERRLSCQSN